MIRTLFAVAALLAASAPAAAQDAQQRIEWNRSVQPFTVVDNVHYVGMEGIAAFLVTTPEGHVLIDGGLPESAPLILDSIKALGFQPADVKVLLNTHAHFDHSGGLAALKAATGAQLVASADDRQALETGRHIGLARHEGHFPAVSVDRAVQDGDTVSLGGVVLTANVTAGHTAGCTSWSLPVAHGGRTLNVVFFCSATVAGAQLFDNTEYPDIVEDFRTTFDRLETMPADVLLANHPGFSELFERRERQIAGDRDALIDPPALAGLSRYLRAAFETELARQQAAR